MSTIGASHNVRVLGSGEKTVVLGHGLGTDQSVWKYLIPHLVDKYKVLLYDNMGAGTTNPDNFDFDRYATLEGFACDLLAILEEFRIEKCIYIGHSLSSMTGALLSIFRPELFHKIIMISASPRFMNTEHYHGGFEKEEIDQLLAGLVSNYKSWVSGFAPLVVGGDMDSETVREFSRTLFNMRPDIALSVYRTVFAFDFRSSLRFVTVPCHILQSVKDMAVPVNVAVYIHRNLGGKSTVEVMLAEGHLPQLSSPEIVIPIIVEHIEHDIADDA